MSAVVNHKLRGSALYLTIENAGAKNALSIALLQDLKQALEWASRDEIRIVFIRGKGRVFSAGADLNDMTGTAQDANYDALAQQVSGLIRACPSPVVALIEGPCMGAAVELVLSCDLRIAARGAYLQVPATRLGLLHNPDAIAGMARRFNPETLMRLLVLGERFNASAALQAGLVGEVVKVNQIDTRAEDLAGLAAQTDSLAAAQTKRLLIELQDDGADLVRWQRQYTQILASDTRKAAVQAVKDRMQASKAGRAN